MIDVPRWHVIAVTGDMSSSGATWKRTVHLTYEGALLKVGEYNRSRRYSTVVLIKGDSRRD